MVRLAEPRGARRPGPGPFLALVLLAACGGDDPGGPASGAPRTPDRDLPWEEVDAAIERASELFRRRVDNLQVCLFLGALRRRFGLEDFADMAERYDAFVAESQPVPDFRALRRILVPENEFPPELVPTLTNEINALTVPALYCDRFTAPVSYRRSLIAAVDRGGYALTHVGLALIFQDALGCPSSFPRPESFHARVCASMAELLRPEDGLSDLELEAVAFLQNLGRGDLVDDELLRAVLLAQLPDGGWAHMSPLASHWHASVMGLWALLEARYPPERKRPLVTAGRRGGDG